MATFVQARNLLGIAVLACNMPTFTMDAPALAPGPSGGFVVMQDNRPGEAGRLTFKEAVRDGFMRGVISSCDRLVTNASNIALIPAIKKMGQVSRGVCKRVVRLAHGNAGFDPEELVGAQNLINRSIATHVSNVAKGARVVRAHVLEQMEEGKAPVSAQMPFGITMLKEDLTYTADLLTERLEHYGKKQNAGTRLEKFIDAAGAVGAGYGATCLARGTADRVAHAVAIVGALRLGFWAHSGRATALVDDLQGLDRATIAHLAKGAIACLKHLMVLCDTVKDDNDIARLKEEFEGLGKHCSEILGQIALSIDADRTTQLQRLSKPGQGAMAMTPSLGAGLGGLPHLAF